jgi:serine/threonine-protein kinase
MLEFAIVVERAVGVRWLQVEQLLRALPQLAAAPHLLAAQTRSRLVIAVLRLEKRSPEAEARLGFWCDQLGFGLLAVSEADLGELANFRLQVEACDFKRPELGADGLGAQLETLGEALGLRAARHGEPSDGLTLPLHALDDALTLSPRGVFYATRHPLPVGERLTVELKLPDEPQPERLAARVLSARTRAQAKPDAPAGIELELLDVPEHVRQALDELVAVHATRRPPSAGPAGAERRAAPRYRVRSPVSISAPAELAELKYESGDALASDYVANLSVGGAFIRSARPLPAQTRVQLRISLPSGESLTIAAKVVNTLATGMGVQFELTPEAKRTLEAEIAALAVRRTALIVDDDAFTLRLLSDALKGRGFSVVTARSGTEAVRLLLDRLPDFDVLVTDLVMPRMGGADLLKLVRIDGGERELIAIVYGGSAELLRGLDARLAIDAVVQKGPKGPGAVAEWAYRLLEARRPPAPSADKAAPAPYAVELKTGDDVAAEAECLRMGGLFVTTPNTLELEEDISVDVTFPGGEILTVGGTVVAVQEHGVGVQLNLQPQERAVWLALIDRHARRRPRSPDLALDRLLHLAPAEVGLTRQRLGPYALLSLLGRGGMAEVFYARAVEGPRAGQPVAIKRLLPALSADADAIELFAGEADVLRLLEHPNVVRTYEVGATGDAYYLVMEAIDGRDLSQVLRKCADQGITLPADFAVYIARAVLDALDHAHHAKGLSGRPLNIVHSDVSPSNVFISREGEIKLGDFGVAQVAGSHATRVFGKPSYLSPDALESGVIDVAADVWAAAVCLYEMLALERPFRAETEEGVLLAIRLGKFAPLQKVRPDLPPALCDVVHRALARQKKNRFESAAALRDALEPHVSSNVAMPLAIAAMVRGLFEAPAAPT